MGVETGEGTAGAPVDEPPTTPPLVLGLEDEVGLKVEE